MGKTLKSYAEWRLQENMREYDFYFRLLKRLVMSMFKWENLPDGITQRYIEETLFKHGFIIFFKSKMGFIRCCKATGIGLNYYGEPLGFRTISENGFDSEIVKSEDCVVIYNDVLRQPSFYTVHHFAKRLSNIDKTIDLNLEHLKHPYVISCGEGQIETVKKVFEDKTNGVPYILTDESFASHVKSINIFNLDVKNETPLLLDAKERIKNECLTFLGVNNVDIRKRERLTDGETKENNEQISINRGGMLEERQRIELFNKKFDCDIGVSFSPYIDSEISELLGGVGSE